LKLKNRINVSKYIKILEGIWTYWDPATTCVKDLWKHTWARGGWGGGPPPCPKIHPKS